MRAASLYAGLGVPVRGAMTDNGPGCRSRELDAVVAGLGAERVYVRPYGP